MSEANNPVPPVLSKSDQNLVWLDCEMTGLEPDTDR
ncbi:MAG TPA: oligoribonuclease, partial [Acidovorax sp.]